MEGGNLALVRSIYADWERGGVLSAWREHRAIAEAYRELDDGGILTLTAFSASGLPSAGTATAPLPISAFRSR